MLTDIAINLLAAFIGFLIAQAYRYFRQIRTTNTIAWFWAPVPSSKIYLYFGAWRNLLSDLGELEPVTNSQDALNLGELRIFLKPYYSEVVVTTDRNAIDWQYPVVSLGGPLPNSLTKEIGDQGLLPIWFLGLPYSKQSERAIGSPKHGEVFKSEFNEHGELVSDVGFIARLKSPKNPRQFLYVIASNYGTGNLGIIRHLTSARTLVQLKSIIGNTFFQVVIRSYVLTTNIVDTKLLHYTGL